MLYFYFSSYINESNNWACPGVWKKWTDNSESFSSCNFQVFARAETIIVPPQSLPPSRKWCAYSRYCTLSKWSWWVKLHGLKRNKIDNKYFSEITLSHLPDLPGSCSFIGEGTRLSVEEELLAMVCRWMGRRLGLFREPPCFGGLCGRCECSFPGISSCCGFGCPPIPTVTPLRLGELDEGPPMNVETDCVRLN